MAEKLAVEGGVPVRAEPLPLPFPGALVMGEEEKKALIEVVESRSPFRYYGPRVLGKVTEFEGALASYLGTGHALGVTSGTEALKVALTALGVGPGDEVIVPAYTFIACASAVVAARAVPVFAEVDDTLNLDPKAVEEAISPRTRAVMAVHLQGVSCDMDALLEIARRKGVAVLEDCAQSFGASYRGGKLGTLGEMGVFSLQINKLITAGEGGCVVTGDRDLFLRAVRFHDHGNLREFEGGEPFMGENFRMNEFAGALGLVQLRKLPDIIDRMKTAKRGILEKIRGIDGLVPRRVPDGAEDIGSSVIFFTPDAGKTRAFVEALNAENIDASRMYGGAIYEAYPQVLAMRTATAEGCPFTCPLYHGRAEVRIGMCPRTEDLAARLVYIPLGPTFGERDIEDVARGVRKVANRLL